MATSSHKKIIILGPAHPYRGGGITTFNQRLAREFIDNGFDCKIYSFSLQYPSFLFPGKSQYTEEPAPPGIPIERVINSINPINWVRLGNRLRRERPDIIIVRFWLPFMGPAFGTIIRRAKKNGHSRIICIADNVIPHEQRPGDRSFTKYFLKSCDAFITMSEKVLGDLRKFEPVKKALLVPHPLYDNFGSIVSKAEARAQLKLPATENIILFFGFIRKYKGLDMLLDAIGLLNDPHLNPDMIQVKLLIAGEFYEDRSVYDEQIKRLGIRDRLYLHTDFIPDAEVRYYLCAADCIVQPYRNATQSGVTPLAYHFEKPMIVTNVGGLPALVPDGKAGLVASADASSIANNILKFYQLGENYFIPHLRSEKQKYSWLNLLNAIVSLASGAEA